MYVYAILYIDAPMDEKSTSQVPYFVIYDQEDISVLFYHTSIDTVVDRFNRQIESSLKIKEKNGEILKNLRVPKQKKLNLECSLTQMMIESVSQKLSE